MKAKPTKRGSPRVTPRQAPDDGLRDMRVTFHARLRSECVHLVTLSAALARAEERPDWIFQDLQFRAHKIRGGAAIFEMPEVAAAARALDEAANAASMSNADNTDPAVWTALVAMVRLMGALDGNTHEPSPPAPESGDAEMAPTANRLEHRTA